MSMTDAERAEHELDDLFALARAGGDLPPADLAARVMADAEAVLQAGTASTLAPVAAPARPARGGLWPQVRQALGGWGGIGGLVTASFAGLWLGLAGVGGDIGLWSGTTAIAPLDLMPDAYALLAAEE